MPSKPFSRGLRNYRLQTIMRTVDIEDIYFFEVNTKYISSSAMKKISIFSRVRSTSENPDIFTTRDEIYLVFAEKT